MGLDIFYGSADQLVVSRLRACHGGCHCALDAYTENYPFGVAYPLTSMSYLFGVFAALLVFHEQVTVSQWVGVLLIMAGCALIVK